MTDDEYDYLTNAPAFKKISARYQDVGVQCYENGWVDDFGLVTPLGEKAIKEYDRVKNMGNG